MASNKSFQEVKKFVAAVASHQGWELNKDQEFLSFIIEGLQKNYNRYGFFMCPCRDSVGDKKIDKDIQCPCDYCVLDQQEYGHCFCGLYLIKEFAATEKEPDSIPERRKL